MGLRIGFYSDDGSLSIRQDILSRHNKPEAIDVWASELALRSNGTPVAIALEQARGAVISMLSKYVHRVLFPVHSTVVAKYRKSFSPSGAKSDTPRSSSAASPALLPVGYLQFLLLLIETNLIGTVNPHQGDAALL